MSDRALLSFRVGGVQQFLNSARTTEDFWVSSYLIAHLTQTAAAKLSADPTLISIFPAELPSGATVSDSQTARFPNGVLADVDASAAPGLGQSMEEAFHSEWFAIAGKVREELKRHGHLSGEALTIWDRQSCYRCFETFWAWTPLIPDDYPSSFRTLSSIIEGRKTLRDFQYTAEPHIKCSLCGNLQSLQAHSDYNTEDSREYWSLLAGTGRRLQHRFRSSERLCTVCTVCRLAGRLYFHPHGSFSYPSTSRIACETYRQLWLSTSTGGQRPKEQHLEKQIGTLQALLGGGLQPEHGTISDMDGDWFYTPTYRPEALSREYGLDDGESLLPAAEDALHALHAARESIGLAEPPSYLALVAADGDRIGDLIASARSVDQHIELSRRLSKIGQCVSDALALAHVGHLIYSGGDDLLVLMPVESVTEQLALWREAFEQETPGLNLSAAVLIFPHNDSLSGAIHEAQTLLKSQAKKRFGRDCIVFSVRRQSGQQSLTVLPWRARPIRALGEISRLMGEKDGISPRFASHVARIARVLAGSDSLDQAPALVDYFLARTSDQPEAIQAVEALSEAVNRWAGHHPPTLLAELLLLARFLSRMTVRLEAKQPAEKEPAQ